MVIQLLGSAAGGGVPQWNCACRQCEAARAGLIETRTQCSVAITSDGHRWVLVNASPDLRSQLIHFGPPSQSRGTPIEAVLLTDADLDHTLAVEFHKLMHHLGSRLGYEVIARCKKHLEVARQEQAWHRPKQATPIPPLLQRPYSVGRGTRNNRS